MGDSMLFSKPGAIDSAHMGRTYGSTRHSVALSTD